MRSDEEMCETHQNTKVNRINALWPMIRQDDSAAKQKRQDTEGQE